MKLKQVMQFLDKQPKRVAVLVRIKAVNGSSPREIGAMMLVGAEECVNSIGGGNLEWHAIRQAREMLASISENIGCNHQTIYKRYSLAANLGQCCGGVINLSFDLLPANLSLSTEILQYFSNLEQKNPSIFVFGAGHIAQALVPILDNLEYDINWIDDRHGVFANLPKLSEQVNIINSDCFEAEISRANTNSYFLVMTYSHQLDLQICSAVLAHENFVFLGMLGSQSKRAKFINRLRQKNIKNFERLNCPIGIENIKSKHPAAIAVAIAAQIINLVQQNTAQQFEILQPINPLARIA